MTWNLIKRISLIKTIFLFVMSSTESLIDLLGMLEKKFKKLRENLKKFHFTKLLKHMKNICEE